MESSVSGTTWKCASRPGAFPWNNDLLAAKKRAHVQGVAGGRGEKREGHDAELLSVHVGHLDQLAKDGRQLALAAEEGEQRSIQGRREQDGQADESAQGHDPRDDDQPPCLRRGARPGEHADQSRQDEEAEQPHHAIDDHRGHRLRLPLLLAAQERRLDHVAAHGARYDEVEHVADEPEADRVAKAERQVQRPHQAIPAIERDQERDQVDHEPDPQDAQVRLLAEHVLELAPVPVDRPAQQGERQEGQGNVDDQRLPARLGGRFRVAYGHGHSVPLVEGTPCPRGSISAASRMALADALKIASAMWWRIAPVVQDRVVIHPRVRGRRLPEIGEQLRVEIADLLGGQRRIPRPERPPAEVHGHRHQGLVHRQDAMPVAADGELLPQRTVQGHSQADPHVLGRVVRVHVEVALAGNRQVEEPVLGEQLKHVIEEPHARADLGPAGAVEVEREDDLRLAGLTADFGGSIGHGVPLALGLLELRWSNLPNFPPHFPPLAFRDAVITISKIVTPTTSWPRVVRCIAPFAGASR